TTSRVAVYPAPSLVLWAAWCLGGRVPNPHGSDDDVTDDGLASLLQVGWMPSRAAGGLASRLMPLAFRVHGRLDVELLGQAISEVCRHHESLRTGFVVDEQGRLRRHIRPEVTVTVQHDRGEQDVSAWLTSRIVPFDVAVPPLLRAHVLTSGDPDRSVLLMIFDHLITDGRSNEIIMSQVAQAYRALDSGRTPDLPNESRTFGQWATAQRSALSDEVRGSLLAGWAALLGDDPAILGTPLPGYDVSRTVKSSSAIDFQLDRECAQQLGEASTALGVSRFALALTLFVRTLGGLQGQDRLPRMLISTSIANRHSPRDADMVGLLAHNTHILLDHLEVAIGGDLADHARGTHESVGRALALSAVPHRMVRDSLWPAAAPHLMTRSLPVVYFALNRDFSHGLTIPGAVVEPWDFDWGSSPPGVEMWLTERESGIAGIFRWETERLPRRVADEIVDGFRAAITTLAAIVKA
ncbi:MAG: condensation domain-containing protein, partial [Frankia sp.]